MVPTAVPGPVSIIGLSAGSAFSVSYRLAADAHFRQSEIQDLGVTAFGHEDVGGLDVTVDDPFSVRGVECVGDLDPQRQHDSSPSVAQQYGASA